MRDTMRRFSGCDVLTRVVCSSGLLLATLGAVAACSSQQSGPGGSGGTGDTSWTIDGGAGADTAPAPDGGGVADATDPAEDTAETPDVPSPTPDAGPGTDGGPGADTGPSDDTGGGGKDGGGTDANGGSDGGLDGGSPDAGGPTPSPTTFRLVNNTNRTLKIQTHRKCEGRGPDWLSFKHAAAFAPPQFRLTMDCTVCQCSEITPNKPCGACAKACARPSVDVLKPGKKVEWTWSGHLYTPDQKQGQSCYREKVPKGRTFRPKFCWGQKTRTSGAGELLTDPTCERVPFQYGSEQLVTKKITSSPKPTPTTFELTNDSNRPIHVAPRHYCAQDKNEWVDVGAAGKRSANYRLSDTCSICSCDDAKKGGCSVCARAPCPPSAPPRKTLKPGETKSWTWPGSIYRNDRVNGQQCLRKALPPTSKLSARFCWFTGSKTNRTRHCTGARFTYGKDTTVKHKVKSSSQPKQPQKTTFELVNKLNKPIRVMPGTICTPDPNWVDVVDGKRTPELKLSCKQCTCSRAGPNGKCRTACRIACQGPTVQRVKAGQRISWTWPGRFYPRSKKGCYKRELPLQKTYDVRFCWSEKKGPTGHGHTLKSTTCETVQLQYGKDKKIVHEVTPSNPKPTPPETDFRLENRSGKALYIQKTEGCGRDPGWLTLERKAKLRVDDACLCRCSTLKQYGSCPACRCVPGMISKLKPGEDASWTWSGHVFSRTKHNGKSCWTKEVAKRAKTQATFCWKSGNASTGTGQLSNLTCKTTSFVPGRSKPVVKTIK